MPSAVRIADEGNGVSQARIGCLKRAPAASNCPWRRRCCENHPLFPDETLVIPEIAGLSRYALKRSLLEPFSCYLIVDRLIIG
jgi:hypothetical protein